jgi:YcaO-like protein with predicted kinase domain
MARDLTTHMGKGQDEQAARVGATMEAIERVSAEDVPGRRRRASFAALRSTAAEVADPERFDLPPATNYRQDLQLEWVEGWDLMGAQAIWIPADLARTPACEGLLDQVDTNGLAAGGSYGEAIRHALLEVIERDTISQHQYFELFGDDTRPPPPKRRLDVNSLPDDVAAVFRMPPTGQHEIALEDLTGDSGVPIAACTLIDHAYPTPRGPTIKMFGGWGADPRLDVAAVRALTEAYQSRAGAIQGARDSFNVLPTTRRPFTALARQQILHAATSFDVSTRTGFDCDDISGDVDFLLERLASIGVDQVIVIDMAHGHLNIPVVRVRVPGLSVFTVDRCRLGWRCARHLL